MPATWKDVLGDAHTDELEQACKDYVGKNFVSKADYNAKVRLIGEHEKTIQDQTTELDNLRKTNVDAAAYEKQLADKDDAHAAEILALKLDFAGINQMRELGARDPEIAWELAKRKLEDPKLNAEGKVEGLDDAGEAIKTEKAYLFFDKKDGGLKVAGTEPAQPGNKGTGNGKATDQMTYSELCEYLAENPDASL